MIMQKADWQKKNEFTDEFADEHAFANVPKVKKLLEGLLCFKPRAVSAAAFEKIVIWSSCRMNYYFII